MRRFRACAIAPLLVAAAGLAAEPTRGTGSSGGSVVYDCSTQAGRFTLAIMTGSCRVDHSEGLLSERDGAVECRISNPQLRIVTIAADLGFVYEDTDSDRVLHGRCARR